ncbi:hypothetical protein IGK74_002380 [Enterococcus sp. AZ150]
MNKINIFFKKFFQLFFLNIHTILLLVGVGFITTAAFLYSMIIGYLVLGLGCLFVSYIIDKSI